MFGEFAIDVIRVFVFSKNLETGVMPGSPAAVTAAYFGKFGGRAIGQSRLWPLVIVSVQPKIMLAESAESWTQRFAIKHPSCDRISRRKKYTYLTIH
jgi:hypothetical protein